MHRYTLQTCRLGLRRLTRNGPLDSLTPSTFTLRRPLATSADYESKYAEKLRQRAQEKGLSVEELKVKSKEEQAEQIRRKREALASQPPPTPVAPIGDATTSTSEKTTARPLSVANVRKDSSPVKPLSSILNMPRIMSTPHTADQISALWTAYHVSRSGGTGRGYVCAAAPLDLYKKMERVAQRYPTFVVPVPRVKDPSEPLVEGEEKTAYEFYFLQWDFHDVPAVPTATEDPFATPKELPTGTNLPTSTILFTPLQEYKLRGAFATPYLILTHYTDFAHTHGTVLLRGEITPAAASSGGGVDGRYMLNQEDAQLLSMAAQKYYLWGGQGQEKEGERLLKCFHETPEDFKWEELLKHANWTI